MTTFAQILNIEEFSVKDIDVSAIKELEGMLPKHKIMDKNIANKILDVTLEGVNLCNEKIPVIDRWLGELDSKKNKAWSQAALEKAKQAGHKTAKDKEWDKPEGAKYAAVAPDIIEKPTFKTRPRLAIFPFYIKTASTTSGGRYADIQRSAVNSISTALTRTGSFGTASSSSKHMSKSAVLPIVGSLIGTHVFRGSHPQYPSMSFL